jgi:hypothetical protein
MGATGRLRTWRQDVVDFTYRLPDGSIKSFPDTAREQDIRWFVAKNFPGRPAQGLADRTDLAA